MEILHVIVVGKFDKSDLIILKWDLGDLIPSSSCLSLLRLSLLSLRRLFEKIL